MSRLVKMYQRASYYLLLHHRNPHSKAARIIKSGAYARAYGATETHLNWLFLSETVCMTKDNSIVKELKRWSFMERYSSRITKLGVKF